MNRRNATPRRNSVLLEILGAALLLALMAGGLSAAGLTFIATGNTSASRAGHTATELGDGRVLITGGLDTGAQLTAEIYTPGTGLFSPVGPMNTPRAFHTATRLGNGKVLVAGGTGALATASAEIYDPATGTFSATGSMSSARLLHTATLLPDGTVLIAGGTDYSGGASSFFASAEIYDPATGTFTPVGSMATARVYATATPLVDGRVLVTGGAAPIVGFLASAEIYDPALRTFSAVGPMSTARVYHTATRLGDGRVLVAGGSDGLALSSAEIYDPATATFSVTGAMSAPRQRHTASLVEGVMYIAGGDNAGGVVSGAESYDPGTGLFSPAGTMTQNRVFHTASALPDGGVLLVGGAGGVASPTSAEIFYTPKPPLADAGPDKSILVDAFGKASVTLAGSGTSPRGMALSYQWTNEFGATVGTTPATTVTVGLGDLGTRTFRLTITDSLGFSASDFVVVAVELQLSGTGSVGPQGPAGPQGAPGPQGPQGPAGPAGAQGLQGAAGTAGDKGDTGAAGPAGSTGPKGDTGANGAPGANGTNGSNGAKGDKGDPGAPGAMGPIGPGVAFDIRRVASDAAITLPSNNHSVIYLATTRSSNITLTLPSAATATSRFIVVQRVDNGRKVIIRTANGEAIDGARTPLMMEDKHDALTIVTDGTEWVVLYRRR